jgi:hypothetical protein
LLALQFLGLFRIIIAFGKIRIAHGYRLRFWGLTHGRLVAGLGWRVLVLGFHDSIGAPAGVHVSSLPHGFKATNVAE